MQEPEPCPLCLEPCDGSEAVRPYRCRHPWHQACAEQLMLVASGRRCGVCRAGLADEAAFLGPEEAESSGEDHSEGDVTDGEFSDELIETSDDDDTLSEAEFVYLAVQAYLASRCEELYWFALRERVNASLETPLSESNFLERLRSLVWSGDAEALEGGGGLQLPHGCKVLIPREPNQQAPVERWKVEFLLSACQPGAPVADQQ